MTIREIVKKAEAGKYCIEIPDYPRSGKSLKNCGATFMKLSIF